NFGALKGMVQHGQFSIDNFKLMCMDNEPGDAHQFNFNEGISLVKFCENQEEIDYYWEKFMENGGEEGRCGWLKDRFKLSWQIIPKNMVELMSHPKNAQKVVDTFMKMNKIDVKAL